jgi:hypothetical protein
VTGVLYHTPAEIIAQMMDDVSLADLETTGTGDPPTEWTVFPIHLPESPEQAILVKDTSGMVHRRIQSTGVMGEHYGIQLLARSSEDPSTPYKKMKQILEYFDSSICRELVTLLDDENVSRTYMVHAITRITPVVPAGNDGRRFFFSGNVIASIELQS